MDDSEIGEYTAVAEVTPRVPASTPFLAHVENISCQNRVTDNHCERCCNYANKIGHLKLEISRLWEANNPLQNGTNLTGKQTSSWSVDLAGKQLHEEFGERTR